MSLKPCPFCGTQPIMEQYARNGWMIRCPNCHVELKQKVIRKSMEWLRQVMAETWNKRVPKEKAGK